MLIAKKKREWPFGHSLIKIFRTKIILRKPLSAHGSRP